MASTPPLQITATPQTPPTPLHGAAYDRVPVRKSSRIQHRATTSTATGSVVNGYSSTPRGKRSVTTPELAPVASPPQHLPAQTPKKTVRRVQVISPESPNTELTPRKTSRPATAHVQPFLSSTTTMSEGMLPTPVKTPKKKEVSNVKAASRALFQDPTVIGEMAAPSPRKSRKHKRYNGFSLESFRAEDGDSESVQIFTDNRDKVPELDTSDSNPFIEKEEGVRAQKLGGGSKRRKISSEKRRDKQVQDAIDQDDGMVYVFRGKKVYRRFADEDEEEEEEIDEEDLGLSSHTPLDGERRRPMRTLTRKSIKPTRLFQTEEETAAREREKEEEAMTDVEDHSSTSSSVAKLSTKDTKPTKPAPAGTTDRKKISPFDQWGRAKKSQDGSTARPGKRTATDAFERVSPGVETRVSTKRKARA